MKNLDLFFSDLSVILIWQSKKAGVMELVDVADSKSADGDIMWVRVPPPAPNKSTPTGCFLFWGGADENPPGEIAPAGAFRSATAVGGTWREGVPPPAPKQSAPNGRCL